MLYHCLPSIFLNETIEFCGPNAAIETGKCPIYNYVFGATAATGRSCTNFTRGCPDPKHSPYHSSSFYKYNACWDINKEFRCFHAEPNCPQREDRRYTTIPRDAKTTPSTDKNTNRFRTISTEARTPFSAEEITNGWKAGTIVAVCIATCLTVVVIGILFYFLKYKRIPTESDDDAEERKAFIVKIHRATLDGRFNRFVKALNEAMSPDVLENIKIQLQERPENKSELASLGNPDEVLTYLDRTYQVFNNVYFLQGLFLAAQAPELYKICLDYAKTRENKIIFFEKQILETDHTKVQYFVNFPNVSSYSNSHVEAVQDTIATLLFANYDDVIVCGIKNGCVIVIFMIRNYLIPHLRVLFGSKEKILFQKMLKHRIFKVVVRDDIIYKGDWQIVVNKPNVVAKPAGHRETSMDAMFHCANVGNGVNTREAKERVQKISRYKELTQKNEPEAGFKGKPQKSEMEESVLIQDSIADRKTESQDKKSNQTDELDIEVERKFKEKKVNRSLAGDSNANRTMKSEHELNQKNEPEAEFKGKPKESEMEESVLIEDSIADRKTESQDKKSKQTDELDIEVERKPKEKEVNRSLTGDSNANRTMKSEHESNQKNKPEGEFKGKPRESEIEESVQIEDLIADRKTESQDEKSNQTDESDIEVERKLKEKKVNRSLAGDSNADKTMKSEHEFQGCSRGSLYCHIPKRATTTTKEDRNFMTVWLALDKPCTKLLQEVLRQHVPEKDIHKLLNDPANKRNIFPFLRKLKQETTLYPQTGVFNDSYADFDLSLLYVLIRNLTGIPNHTTGWGNVPDSLDNSIAANIERIRLLRNEYAHASTSHLSDKEFKKARKNIISCIHGIERTLRLNSTQFEDAVEEIFNAAKEQEDLRENVTKCQETAFEKAIFHQWQEEDAFFISTKAAENVREKVETNNLVIVTGYSGSGKSAIIQHIALKYRKNGWIVKPVYSFKEIHDTYKTENFEKGSHIFVFNDPIGKESYDEMSYNEWGRYREILNLLIKKAKLMLTCRRSIVSDKRAAGFFEQKLGEVGINEQKLVKIDINDDHYKLSTYEKKTMFNKYMPDAKPTQEEYSKMFENDMYFPLLCKLCRGDLMQNRNIADVFKEPVNVLEREIKAYKTKDKETYCGLICLVLINNGISVHDLKKNVALFSKTLQLCELHLSTSPSTIIDKLKPICGFLVKKNGERYFFYNDFVMEVTTYVFGSEHPAETLEYADISFLRKRVRVEKNESSDPHSILLNHRHIDILVNRFLKELIGERFIEVILSPCLRNEYVITCFKEHLKDLSDQKMLDLITKPRHMKTEHQELQHLMNECWYTRLQFVSSQMECSPLFAMIALCHDDLSMFCLNLLVKKKKKTGLWGKKSAFFLNIRGKNETDLTKQYLFPAICANGNKDFFQMFTDHEIIECKNIRWNNMYPIHIISVFHNYHILDTVTNEDTHVDIFTTNENEMTPLMLASGNNTQDRGCKIKKETESTESIPRNKTVKYLLNRGADINLCNEKGISSLFTACRNGHESTAQLLLFNGAKVNLCDKNVVSPLWIACYNGHERTAKLLLVNGADINLCNNGGRTPLWVACCYGHESIAKLLLVNGADMNLCNKKGTSPLWVACLNGHESTAKLLLVNGAEVNLCNKKGTSPLLAACSNGHENTAKLLLINDAIVNLCDKKGTSPLWVACCNEHENTAKLLLNNGADVDLCNEDGLSPLWIACSNGHERTAKLLLVNGANMNLCNMNGHSPLWIACYNGHESTAKHLLINGAIVNLCDKKGTSPLWVACCNGHENTAKLLLVNGAGINFCDENGTSPLWIACYNGHKRTAKLLLVNGADVNLCDNDGASPLLVSCSNEHESTANLLLSNGADMNLCNKKGTSPLWKACYNGHESTAKLLLVNGADVNLCDNDGASPLLVSCSNEHKSTANLLLSNGADMNLCNKKGTSPLWVACLNGNESTAKYLLVNGADMNLCDKKGTSPLWVACLNEHESIAKLLLVNGADINFCDENGTSPLWIACYNGHERTAKLLLVNGADINLCNNGGWTPLWVACCYGHESIAKLLLVNGADMNLCNKKGTSPLWVACLNGHESTAKLLLVNGAEVNLCNKKGTSPLLAACYNGHENTAKLLLINDAIVNLCNKKGTSPLWVACCNEHENTAKVLLNNGAKVNLCNKKGTSPLWIACLNGHERTAKLLLVNGADINFCDENGTSPLWIACYNGHERTATLLLVNGADVNLCDNDGASPLLVSCSNGHESTANLLLSIGADMNLCNKDGDSPLLIACWNRHENTARLLLNNGTDVNLCNKDGHSPLRIACFYGHENTAKLLLVNGADINLCDKDGLTPLWVACSNGHENTVKLLLVHGADVNLCDKNGISPQQIACQNGHNGCELLLLNNGVAVN
nr:uncharacterized protein LOC111114647 isoform X2 [Crassostrea virginica]